MGGSKGGKNRKPLLACKALYLLTFLKMGGKRGSIYSFGLKNKKIYNKYKITFLLPLLPPNAGTPCKCVVFGGAFLKCSFTPFWPERSVLMIFKPGKENEPGGCHDRRSKGVCPAGMSGIQ